MEMEIEMEMVMEMKIEMEVEVEVEKWEKGNERKKWKMAQIRNGDNCCP